MSETRKLEGKVIHIGETQTFDSGFTKREIVVETKDEKYPQQIPVEFLKEKIEKTEGLRIGDEVSICFDLRGREGGGRYWLSLAAWGCRVVEPAQQEPKQSTGTYAETGDEGEGDDIPF